MTGGLERHVVGFVREWGESILMVVVPRLVYRLLQAGDGIAFAPDALRDGILSIPAQIRGRRFQSLFTDQDATIIGAQITLELLLSEFPLAVLHSVASA